MTNHEARRTLLKSAPELWAECSDAKSLARHLGAFGEIHITRLEPETVVAWEGAAASGTVRLEPSGWGTRVVLTATSRSADPEPQRPEPAAVTEAEPAAQSPQPAVAVADEAEITVATDYADEPEAPVETSDVCEETPAAPAGLFAWLREWLGRDRRGEQELLKASVDEVAEANEAWAAAEPDEGPAFSEPDEAVTVAEADVDTGARGAEEPIPMAANEPAPTAGALDAALDSLGRAHHRPYSRS